MKKTFTFFAISALFLMLLFPVSVKADPIVKYFGYHDNEWTQNGNVEQSAGCCAGYIAASEKIVTGSDFYYSGKHQDAVERDGDNWTGFNGSNGTIKACTRAAVPLSASTTYTFSLLTKDKGEMDITLPKISIDGTNYVGPQKVLVNSVEQSFSNNQYRYTNNEETVLEYSITAPSSSDYTVSVQFTSGYRDKFKASTLTITQNAPTYAVTATASNGTVSGTGSFAEGATVTLTPNPNPYYAFSSWSGLTGVSVDGYQDDDPLTFTMPAGAVSVTANFVSSPCTNTKTIQCEDYVNYDTKPSDSNDNKPSGLVKEDHTGYGAPEEGYYADYKKSTGEMWIPVTLPAGTFTFTVRYVKGGDNMWFNLYNVSTSSKIANSKKLSSMGDSWGTDVSNSYTLSAGDYVIGIYANAEYTGLDQITITANSNVFCQYDITMVNNMGGAAPTADKVKAEENASVSISAAETIGEFTFTGWTATAGSFDDASAASTTFTMPAEAVTITANYNTYSRTGAPIAAGNYGTICLPLNGTVTGATLYSVAGKETGDISYLVLEDKGTSLEAGKPYIFQLSADVLSVALDGTYTDRQAGNGLVGTYETINLTPYAEPSTLNYVLNENVFKKAGNNVTVGAYRAYLDWDAVSAPAQAPGARRIRMVIEGKEVQTGMETVTAMPKTTKVLIDGQLFIIREGKRYTLTGARAQ